MTTKGSNQIREKWTKLLMEMLSEIGEDVSLIASNSFNFPVCTLDENGNNDEEGWVEIVIKVPKDDNEGEAKREEYELKTKLKAEKAIEAEKKKQAKIAKDNAIRAEKQAQLQKLREGKIQPSFFLTLLL